MKQIALDLGTSTLAGLLLDADGVSLAEVQLANPQRELGADVLARLQLAHEGGGARLQALLIDGARAVISRLLADAKVSPSDVAGVAAAGNPAISCLLRNLPVDSLLFPPHKPPYRSLATLSPPECDLGLPCPLQLFPLVSGFVGGDLVACLLALGDVPAGTLLVDIGTNAELALWTGAQWLVS